MKMNKVMTFLKHEIVELLPPTIFFFVVFHIILFVQSLMAEQYGIPALSSATATIGALIVGKSILIADALPLFRKVFRKRLIYNVLWRVFLYVIIVLLIKFIEELIHVIREPGSNAAAVERAFANIEWPHFLAVLIILVGFLGVYCLATAVTGVVGGKRIKEILFGLRETDSDGE